MAEPETSIGGYRLGPKVRTGPHLAVFAGEDSLGREIEIACYRAKSLRDRTGVDTFLAEARKSASLHHENLCPMVNAGEEGEIWYSVSVAPKAPSIRDLLSRGGPLAPERVEVVAERILAALEHMHATDLRHGDIRPETVFLSGPRVLLAPRRLIPLGLAERDLRYVAPEEIRADGTDIRADLFAFGTVLFEALTGRSPFSGQEAKERLTSITAGPPELPAGLPPGLQQLLFALLAAGPDDRPARPAAGAMLLASDTSAAPPARAAAARPEVVAPPPKPAARRTTGALRFTYAGQPAVYELWGRETFIELGKDGPGFVPTAVPGVVARVVRGELTDEIHAVADASPHPRVNGSLIDRHDLEKDDVVKLGDHEMKYGPARPEPKKPALTTARRERGNRAAILVSFLLSIAAVGWGFVRIPEALNADQEVLVAADRAEKELAASRKTTETGGVADSGLSVKARIEFEKAQAFAIDDPGNFDGIRSRFQAVRDRFGPTAYGYLAQKEMDENEVRRRADRDREFDTLAKEAAACIEDGRLYDAYEMMDSYEQTHPGTLYAGRAEREALNLLETIAARFNEDMDRVHRLTQEGDFGLALDVLGRVKKYAGPDERTKAEREIRAIRKRIRETQLPEGPGEKPVAEGPKQPDKEPVKPPVEDQPPEQDIPVASPAEEKKAERLLAAARKAMEREKFAEAFEATKELAVLAHTAVCRKSAKEIRRIHGLSRLEVLGAAALFHGAVKIIRGREVEITYDFSTPEQVKDWQYFSPFAHPLSGSFWIQSDALHGRGVGAALHPAEFEPATMTLKTRVKALEPQDFGVLMLEPEEQVNFYFYAVQNRFFVIKLDRPVHENVLGIHGPGAWADTPDGFHGWVRKNGSPKPAITSGEWLTLEAKKVKGTMEMVVKGTSIKGSAFGDNRYVFPALQPAVYVIKGDALFDDIVIRGTLKESWIQSRMRWERKKLMD